MQVIVIDRDPRFLSYVDQALGGSGYDVVALGNVEALPAPREIVSDTVVIYGLEAGPLGDDDRQRLGALQAAGVLVIGAVAHVEVSESALAAGAHDVVVKPVSETLLRLRLQVAQHHLGHASRKTAAPLDVLHEALDNAFDGEVAVHGTEVSGSISIRNGEVVWVDVGSEARQLVELANRADLTLDQDTIDAIHEESRRTRLHFAEVLLNWGYLDQVGGLRCIRDHLAHTIRGLLGGSQASALFVARPAAFAWTWGFSPRELTVAPVRTVSDVIPAMVPSTRGPQRPVSQAPAATAELVELADEVAQLPGCSAVSVVDRASGLVLQRAGNGSIIASLSWAMISTLRALDGAAHDTLVEESKQVHIARVLDERHAVVASFSLASITVGLARTAMRSFGRTKTGDTSFSQRLVSDLPRASTR